MEAAPEITRSSEQSSRRFAANVFANVVALGLKGVVGIWLTKYLIEHLGVGLFGIVPLAVSITSYMSIIDSSLHSAVARFLTIDLSQGQAQRANQTFNTAFWTSLVIGLVLLPVAGLVSYFAPTLFNVPPGHEPAVQWLFAATMLAYLISIVRSNFTVSAFAKNRFDLLNVVLTSDLLLRVGLIVVLFSLVTPELWHVGGGVFLGALGSLLMAIVFWRWLTPELRIGRDLFDLSRLRAMSSMSGWFIINQAGTLFFLSIDLIVVNLFLGADTAGRYGSVLQWSILLRALAITVASVMSPMIFTYYAQGDRERMAGTSRQAVKLLGLGLALPIGIISGLSSPLLYIWLGSQFTELSLLMVVMTAHLCINLAVLPLFSIQVAFNKVRWPGIISLVSGLLNLLLAITLVNWRPDGLGVAVAGAVILTLKNAVFTPIYNAYIQGMRWNTFITSMVPGIMGATTVGILGYLLAQMITISSWLEFGSISLLVSVLYAGVVYLLVLTHKDRRLLLGLIPKRA